MSEQLGGIFILIADLWPNFKTPETKEGLKIWRRNLGMHNDQTIMMAIEHLYKTEHFFSFSKLIDILGDMTKPQLMPKTDVIATIKKMATNSRQDISDRPEIIRQTIRHAGGLIKLGQRTWDQWTEKEVAAAYDEAIRVMEKPKHDQIDNAQRLRINQ